MTVAVFLCLLSLTFILSLLSVQLLPSSVWPEKERPKKQTQAPSSCIAAIPKKPYTMMPSKYSKDWPVLSPQCTSVERDLLCIIQEALTTHRLLAGRTSLTGNLAQQPGSGH